MNERCRTVDEELRDAVSPSKLLTMRVQDVLPRRAWYKQLPKCKDDARGGPHCCTGL